MKKDSLSRIFQRKNRFSAILIFVFYSSLCAVTIFSMIWVLRTYLLFSLFESVLIGLGVIALFMLYSIGQKIEKIYQIMQFDLSIFYRDDREQDDLLVADLSESTSPHSNNIISLHSRLKKNTDPEA